MGREPCPQPQPQGARRPSQTFWRFQRCPLPRPRPPPQSLGALNPFALCVGDAILRGGPSATQAYAQAFVVVRGRAAVADVWAASGLSTYPRALLRARGYGWAGPAQRPAAERVRVVRASSAASCCLPFPLPPPAPSRPPRRAARSSQDWRRRRLWRCARWAGRAGRHVAGPSLGGAALRQRANIARGEHAPEAPRNAILQESLSSFVTSTKPKRWLLLNNTF
jgi:hypothetical protein